MIDGKMSISRSCLNQKKFAHTSLEDAFAGNALSLSTKADTPEGRAIGKLKNTVENLFPISDGPCDWSSW